MLYNLQHPMNKQTFNSIIDNKLLTSYASYIKKYPLKIDIAIPLFSWLSLFQGNNFIGLINNVTEAEMQIDENKHVDEMLLDWRNHKAISKGIS